MQASDLRIGNWIYDLAMGKVQVRGTTKGAVWIKDDGHPGTETAFSPIPLTEEWLLKFGFEKTEWETGVLERIVYRRTNRHTVYQFVLNEEYPETNPNCGYLGVYDPAEKGIPAPTNDNLDNTIDLEESLVNFAWSIKYVHDLQNIWHALTKTELDVQPN